MNRSGFTSNSHPSSIAMFDRGDTAVVGLVPLTILLAIVGGVKQTWIDFTA